MRKILFVLLCSILFISCKKDRTDDGGGPKIYFSGHSTATAGWQEIYSTNEDGSGQKQLNNFSSGGALHITTREPVLSYDGTKIYFVSDKDFPGGELFSMDIDGSAVTKVLSSSILGNDLQDLFLYQNGQKIVYGRPLQMFPNWNGEILSVDINGSNKVKLTNNAFDAPAYYPCVNAANTTIIYTSFVSAFQTEIYAMNMNGTNKRALTSGGPEVKYHPQFSPDGTKIVFQGNVNQTMELFIINANGTNIFQLTHFGLTRPFGVYSRDAIFSKDGKSIYYSSNELDGKTTQLYKMNIDGTGNTRLTFSEMNKYKACVK